MRNWCWLHWKTVSRHGSYEFHAPVGAIPCCEPDAITGHWPHWVKVNPADRDDMWHMTAYQNSNGQSLPDGTYEVIGPHFRNNPHGLEVDMLVKHGDPRCKIKRSDFGFKWN